MDRSRTIDDYKVAGAWMRICKDVISNTWEYCSTVLNANDCRMFDTASRRISILCSRAENNMFRDHPELDNDALDIFYGAADCYPRTSTDHEQIQLMKDLVINMFGENRNSAKACNETAFIDSEVEKMIEDVRNVPKVKAVNPVWLRDLIMLFTWLDEEHQDAATSALNAILQEQMRGEKHE